MQPYQGKHAPKTVRPPYSPTPVTVSRTGGKSRHGRHSRKKWVLVLVLLLVLMLPLLDCMIEPALLTVDRQNIIIDSLPSDIGHLRIVYVSDIHYGYFFSDGRLESLIDRINGLNPDLVLFGGDYGTDNLSAIQFFKKLSTMTIHARYRVLGVIGDTDRGDSSFELSQLQDAMKSANVIPLVNSVETVRIGSSSIRIVGLDDVLVGTPDVTGVASSVSNSDFVILLAHNPSIIQTAQSATDSNKRLNWFDLALFGHTHGNQMKLVGSLLGLTEDIPDRYHSGWLMENRIPILVSNGVGMEIVPFRFLTPPQIHQIDLSTK